ncbi:MAG: PfkB family carbohydrate kinase, partial [Planctomycetia bacterium]|nr:PfkB family carbohydrate kinase [Planctomycetia bacterium]
EAPGRLTPTYTKPLRMMQDEPPEELHRLDMRTRGHVPAELEDRLLEAIDAVIGCVDAVVIADQISTSNEGMITDRVRSELVGLARKRTDKNFIADSRSHIAQFKHMITKPNQFEAVRIMGAGEGSARDPDAMGKPGRQIAEKNQQPVFNTLGAEGILACTESSATHIPTWRAEGEIDAVGAGDSTLSGIISATIAGANVEEAAILGNMVASVTVEQIGTTGTASPQQVISRYRRWAELHPHLAQ